jgi:imidazolonepropionase-like amidohydrolase
MKDLLWRKKYRMIRLLGVSAAVVPFLAVFLSAQGNKSAETQGPYNTLVIRDAMVIDGTGAPAKGPLDIVIKGNRITEVLATDPISVARRGMGAQRPTGDRVIEAKGMYVMPGIVDMHTHVLDQVPAEYIYKLWLAQGVTTIRLFNLGSKSPEGMVAEKRRVAANELLAPRMYVYPFWDAPAGTTDPRFATPGGAREIVREWKAKGVDGIKIIGKPGLYPDVLRAICAEARANGMGVAVHIGQDGVYPMNALEVARAGVTSIEHHYGYPEASFSDKTIQNLPADYNYLDEPARFLYTGKVWLETDLTKLHGEVLNELLELSKKTGFTMDPTFVPYEGNRDVARVQNLPWHAEFSMPVMLDFWRPNPAHHASFYYHWTSADEAVWARMFRRWMDFVNDYKNHGGAVSVGSDPGFQYNLWGFATIREMELLEDAGFTPLEVIHSATEVGARALGNPELGVIRPGYLADLVVLSANPLENLKVLYGIGVVRVSSDGKEIRESGVKYTIRDGVVIDSQALLRDIRQMVQQSKISPPTHP